MFNSNETIHTAIQGPHIGDDPRFDIARFDLYRYRARSFLAGRRNLRMPPMFPIPEGTQVVGGFEFKPKPTEGTGLYRLEHVDPVKGGEYFFDPEGGWDTSVPPYKGKSKTAGNLVQFTDVYKVKDNNDSSEIRFISRYRWKGSMYFNFEDVVHPILPEEIKIIQDLEDGAISLINVPYFTMLDFVGNELEAIEELENNRVTPENLVLFVEDTGRNVARIGYGGDVMLDLVMIDFAFILSQLIPSPTLAENFYDAAQFLRNQVPSLGDSIYAVIQIL